MPSSGSARQLSQPAKAGSERDEPPHSVDRSAIEVHETHSQLLTCDVGAVSRVLCADASPVPAVLHLNMVRYSIFSAATPQDLIFAAWGHEGDGVQRADTKRRPDFGVFRLPIDERSRDYTIVNMFANWCLATEGHVLIAWDDATGVARAWRFSAADE